MNEIKEIKSPLAEFYFQQNFLTTSLNGDAVIPFFSNAEDEYNALVHGVAYYDRSNCSLIQLTGKEVLDFLNRISTNECSSIPRGSSRRTIFTSEKGRILDSTLVLNFGENQLLLGNRGTNSKLLRWLDRYIIMDDVKPLDLTGKMGVFEILGPQAESFLILLFGDAVESLVEDEVKRVEFDDISLFLCRTKNFAKEETFILLGEFPSIQKTLLYSRLHKSVFNFSLVGETAYNSYRIEKGIPNQNELNDKFNPHDALLLDEVSFTKGCYIGQEVIARLDTYDKVQRMLIGFEFDSLPPRQSFTFNDEAGNEVGQITSVAFSFGLKKYVGLGYIKMNQHSSQATFNLKIDGTNLTISIKNFPLTDGI